MSSLWLLAIHSSGVDADREGNISGSLLLRVAGASRSCLS